jgi:hypothetical protein
MIFLRGGKTMRKLIIALGFLLATTPAYASPDSVFAVVHGDTVIIWNTDAEHYCGAQFLFHVSLSNRTVTVTERDTSRSHLRCICTYDLSVLLTGLQSGRYDVNVYRQYFTAYPRDTILFVGSTSFNIGPSAGHFVQTFYQSLCKASPDVDVFPLAIGNHWTYRYFTQVQQNSSQLFVTTDSGRATYSIIQAIRTSDSTRWVFREHRDLIHRFETNTWDTTYAIRDSTTFELIENLTGQHQLYVNGNYLLLHVFFFTKDFTDTISVFRYRKVRANGTITFQSKKPGTLPPPLFHSLLTFERGVGLREVDYKGGFIDLSQDAFHYLLNSTITSVRRGPPDVSPTAFHLFQNYPNPFNPLTHMRFDVPRQSFVVLKVFDILGREVITLANEERTPGTYEVVWDASASASGVYFCRLATTNFVQTRKLLLLR